jgi:hypothetical protein
VLSRSRFLHGASLRAPTLPSPARPALCGRDCSTQITTINAETAESDGKPRNSPLRAGSVEPKIPARAARPLSIGRENLPGCSQGRGGIEGLGRLASTAQRQSAFSIRRMVRNRPVRSGSASPVRGANAARSGRTYGMITVGSCRVLCRLWA